MGRQKMRLSDVINDLYDRVLSLQGIEQDTEQDTEQEDEYSDDEGEYIEDDE